MESKQQNGHSKPKKVHIRVGVSYTVNLEGGFEDCENCSSTQTCKPCTDTALRLITAGLEKINKSEYEWAPNGEGQEELVLVGQIWADLKDIALIGCWIEPGEND